jgi:hypothetical protein
MENREILARLLTLKTDRSAIEGKWFLIDRYIVPLDQGSFMHRLASENEKNWSSKEVWDSTAPIGQDRLVSMFYAGLLSGRWLEIGIRNSKVRKDQKAKEWVEDSTDRLFDAIMASNFPVEVGSLLSHWVNYGNGCMSENLVTTPGGDWDGLDFNCRPPRAMFFEDDWQGRVLRSWTPLEWTAAQIVSKFRDPNDETKPHSSIPAVIIQQEQSPSGGTEKHKLVYYVGPRKGAKPMGIDEKVRDVKLRPIETRYILEDQALTLGEEGGEYEMPVFRTRYLKSAQSDWGYGPSMLVLPTVGLLNGIQEQVVDAGAKVLDPATLTTEWGLLSDLDLAPGGHTTVRSLDDIKPYESGARFDVSNDLLNRHAGMIRQFYREDDISFRDSPQMSATEAQLRDERLNALFGIPIRRIYWELFRPVVQTTFNHMLREGQFDDVPDILRDPKSKPRMQINFQGRFARALRSDEVASIERVLAMKAAMTKMDPGSNAKHVIDDAKAIRETCERLSTPAAMLRSEQDVTTLEQQDKQMQQQAAAAQIGKTAAEGQRAAAGAQQMQSEMQQGGGMPPGGGM